MGTLKTAMRFLRECLILGLHYLTPSSRRQFVATAIVAALWFAAILAFVMVVLDFKYGGFPDFIHHRIFTIRDGGIIEIVGYLMVAATIIFISNVMMAKKQFQWAPFLVVLALVLTDDIFQLHEFLGIAFETKYNLNNYVTDFLGFMCLGTVGLTGWLAGLYLCPKNTHELKTYFVFSAYLGALTFVGVILDAVDAYMYQYYPVHLILATLIEEGSEMTLMCLIALTAFGFRQEEVTKRITDVETAHAV